MNIEVDAPVTSLSLAAESLMGQTPVAPTSLSSLCLHACWLAPLRNRPTLSKYEMEVVRFLWSLGEATVREVHQALSDTRTVASSGDDRNRFRTGPHHGSQSPALGTRFMASRAV
jgi:hypothetical protein